MKSSENSPVSADKTNVIKSKSFRDLIEFYVPLTGVISYTTLSLSIMYPRHRIFADKDFSNLLLVTSLLGTGTYIYTRKHIQKAPPLDRNLYSGAGAVLLSLGSVLIWSVLRSIIPSNSTISTITGVSTSLIIIKIGQKYLAYVDKLSEDK